jgi:ABC-type antimicrobial peptide transport system permease subunit
MSSAGFAINDLMRRKLQTSLTVATLTLSVASTLFLLLFSNRLGIGFASATGTLTLGLTEVLGQFIVFIGVLIFVVGAVLTSFIVFLMMAQRTRDFGLIKAVGCPNSLVAGYFTTELLTVTFLGCVLGIVFGFLADFAVANVVFSGYSLPNFWFAPLVFAAFFVLAVFFGLQPILKASRMSPIKALSPVNYYGLTTEKKHKPMSRRGITWRIASRSLVRRQSASIRIVILLSIVFMLLTVSVAGGIIASGTTISWIESPVGKNTLAIAQSPMLNQYRMLLSKFSEHQDNSNTFNYSDPSLAVPETVVSPLKSLSAVAGIDSRLVLDEHVEEVDNFTFVGQDNSATRSVGDHRQGESIIIGVNPGDVIGSWSVKGHFLSENSSLEAVVGDSISNSMYSRAANRDLAYSDPLLESIRFENVDFGIVGVCVDPMNNGLVTYVPIDTLENATGLLNPNMLLVELSNSTDRSTAIAQIKNVVQASDSSLDVLDLNGVVEQNTGFLASNWQTIMLMPLLTVVSAALCLVGYMMLTVDEQHQEFAVLRAVGAKPRIIMHISAIQSLIVLISSFATGISLGIITAWLILMTNPLVTGITILEITGWLLAALIGMFLLSLYPAYRLAKTSILKIMT